MEHSLCLWFLSKEIWVRPKSSSATSTSGQSVSFVRYRFHPNQSSLSFSLAHTLQWQFRLYIPFLGIARPQPNFHFMCLKAIYIFPGSVHIFPPAEKKGRPIVGIYNSLTDTWMWKLELRPRYSFSGNICLKFSAFCLCCEVLASDRVVNIDVRTRA